MQSGPLATALVFGASLALVASWGVLRKTESSSVFCSSALSTQTASSLSTRSLPSCPAAIAMREHKPLRIAAG